MTLSRRNLARGAMGLGAAAALSMPLRAGAHPSVRTATAEPFTVPLPLPERLRPLRLGDVDLYQLTTRETEVELLPGVRSRVRTYNGHFAPLIEARRGRRVAIRQVNRLPVPFAMHLHGGHVPQRHDGHPMHRVEPGDDRFYAYPNEQQAATLWLHDHTHHHSAESIYRGLAATYAIGDETEDALPLPKGRYDVHLQLRDAKFDDDGRLVYDLHGHLDRPTYLVNGAPRPYFPVAARKYRLRLLNTSNDRIFMLRFRGGLPLQQIASDGGLLPAPAPVSVVRLWPAERCDVVVDFSAYPVGSRLVLENAAAFPGETTEVLRFDVERRAHDRSRVPERLRPVPSFGPPVREREIRLRFDPETGHHLINGRVFDSDRIDFRPRLDETEVWRVVNEDAALGIPHSMHPHLSHFRILDRNGRPPGPEEAGLKDTVPVPPGESVRFAVQFTDHSGLFMYHCHMLSHVAMGMMGQMEVVR